MEFPWNIGLGPLSSKEGLFGQKQKESPARCWCEGNVSAHIPALEKACRSPE